MTIQAARGPCPSTGTRTGPRPTPASWSTTRPPTTPWWTASTSTVSRKTSKSQSDEERHGSARGLCFIFHYTFVVSSFVSYQFYTKLKANSFQQCVCVSVFRKKEPYVIISIILVPNINKISKNISMFFWTPHTEFFTIKIEYRRRYFPVYSITIIRTSNILVKM